MLYGLLAVVLMAMDHRGKYVPRLRSVAEYAVEPVYHVIDWPVNAARSLYGQFEGRRSLRTENERLEKALLRQRAALQRMESLERENERLRALFQGAESQPYEYRFAELLQVDLDPFSHRVMIDRGSEDGVQPGQAVIDGAGVMGQVEDVHLHDSSVRLISDPNHALPVQISRTGLRTVAFGLGDTGRMSLPNVPREADVREGDLVVTSGLGERFPGGYPVARVTSIDRGPGRSFARVEARPLAALDRGREVLLISTPRPVAAPDDGSQAPDGLTAEGEAGSEPTPSEAAGPAEDSGETAPGAVEQAGEAGEARTENAVPEAGEEMPEPDEAAEEPQP
jgi:rod shape-determining protein MreC